MLHEGRRLFGANHERLKRAARKTGAPKRLFDEQRATGDVGGMFQQHGVAGHERGRGDAVDLPERKIPRHDGEQHAQRLIGDVAVGRCAGGVLVGEIGRAVGGVEIATERALLDFGECLRDRLAHLRRGQSGKLNATAMQLAGERPEPGRALRKRRASPQGEGPPGPRHHQRALPRRVFAVGAQFFSRGGIQSGNGHELRIRGLARMSNGNCGATATVGAMHGRTKNPSERPRGCGAASSAGPTIAEPAQGCFFTGQGGGGGRS